MKKHHKIEIEGESIYLRKSFLSNKNKNKREYLGKIGSEEYRKNMSNLIKQRIKEGCNHYYFPKDLWKGKKHSEKTKKKISKSLQDGYKKGRKVTRYWKGKIRTDLLGKKRSKETIEKIKQARSKQILPLKDSKIELKIQDLLTLLKIEFITHKYMNIKYGYQCDIFIPTQKGIPQKTVIECDGDYWHGNLNIFPIKKMSPKIKEKKCLDYERTAQLEEAGFNVIRLWENEIKIMKLNDLKSKVIMLKDV